MITFTTKKTFDDIIFSLVSPEKINKPTFRLEYPAQESVRWVYANGQLKEVSLIIGVDTTSLLVQHPEVQSLVDNFLEQELTKFEQNRENYNCDFNVLNKRLAAII